MTQGIEGSPDFDRVQAQTEATPDTKIAYYPVFTLTDEAGRPADPEFDLRLPPVRERLVASGLASTRCGRPVLAAERDALLAQYPELAAQFGWDGSAEPLHVPVQAMTKEEVRAQNSRAIGDVIPGRQHHTNGDAQSSMASREYNGNLYGFPLRIGGLTHH